MEIKIRIDPRPNNLYHVSVTDERASYVLDTTIRPERIADMVKFSLEGLFASN